MVETIFSLDQQLSLLPRVQFEPLFLGTGLGSLANSLPDG